MTSPYYFSEDYFSGAPRELGPFLDEYKGRPHLEYLEVGVHEGRSLFWMLDNILTHPDSRATAVDTFSGSYEKTFLKNLENSDHTNRVAVVKGIAQVAMRPLPLVKYDIIFVDAGHRAFELFILLSEAWLHLKPRGILIIDDFLWEPQRPVYERPESVIRAFLTAFQSEIEILHIEYRVVIRKKIMVVLRQNESLFGQYIINWENKKIFSSADYMELELSNTERDEILKAAHDAAVIY
jgi:predicted O-methyltransferase YrrM